MHETKKKHQDGIKHMITRYPLVINATVYLVSKSTLSIQGRFHYQPLSRNKGRPSRGVREDFSRLWSTESTDLFTANLTYQLTQLFGCIHSELLIMDGYVSKILLTFTGLPSHQWSTCHEN